MPHLSLTIMGFPVSSYKKGLGLMATMEDIFNVRSGLPWSTLGQVSEEMFYDVYLKDAKGGIIGF